jgi:integrase/recombinase XerD
MSRNEAERLLAMAGGLKIRVMLALGYGCGLRAGEIVRLKAGDIDSAQNIIRIVQAKGRKDRHVMLPPEVLSLLRQWWKVGQRVTTPACHPWTGGCSLGHAGASP